MASLKGSKTHENLKAAFAGESRANRRYLYFAKEADVEGWAPAPRSRPPPPQPTGGGGSSAKGTKERTHVR
jgi:hypothetical protein